MAGKKLTWDEVRTKHPVIGELLDGNIDEQTMHFIEQAIKVARDKAQRQTGLVKGQWIRFTDACPDEELRGQKVQIDSTRGKLRFSTMQGNIPYQWLERGFIEVVPAPSFMNS
jgi:hypothetical protein